MAIRAGTMPSSTQFRGCGCDTTWVQEIKDINAKVTQTTCPGCQKRDDLAMHWFRHG